MSELAVIFDVDGVLVDSYDAHFHSWLQLYTELGVPYSEAAFAADFGRTSRDILQRQFGDALSAERIAELDRCKEAYYREILSDDFHAMDGAMELIDALAEDGFRLAVGSSGPPENVAIVLEKLGDRGRFGAVVTGAEVSRGKPDPQVFQLAADRLGLPPRKCAVVEDAVHGVAAAKRAGMTAIALTGTATRTELSSADHVVASLRELTPARIRGLIEG